ncbi:SDR family NAD(P)-dependent oxidoreductase [Phytomonospora endophytica]|uniref:NAD(P)-dependent dehydrogenase (Short-subunit alcohol dehydrogenase family) n=1 Tax=Phytomonospora endophytica TaxID=714109 RepID=A0A841FBA6_9ACTN|nr:SDR family oxidoreductase [Phytomonospora endophytica]MBB6033536.1 NAD(P)-dependent dehydrogenase (short-subunit alcohol dehydrogenase family) [Phytomonospora endophytica]GIG64946.1 short-chain dehydrogenase [Phytomonospora endophytica]
MNTTTKTALITGASRGLGRAIAASLAERGWRLILTARGEGPLETVATELGARALAGDVADPEHRAALADLAAEAGGLDLLVNNASGLGATPLPKLADYPLGTLRELFDTNVLAPLALAQATLPGLRRRHGAILNITSDAAVEGYEGWGGYGATKAALEQLSNVLAAEEPDVAVWWVDPGEMRTVMLADAIGVESQEAPEPDGVGETLADLVFHRPASGRHRAAELVAGGAA